VSAGSPHHGERPRPEGWGLSHVGLTAHGLRLTAYGSRLTAYGLRPPVLTVTALPDVWQALQPAAGWLTTAWTVVDGAGREYRSDSPADAVASTGQEGRP